MLAEAVVLQLRELGGLDRNIEFVKGALRERRDALVEALRRADPRGRVRRARGRLLPLARPRRGHRHAGAACRGEGEGVTFVAGPDFMIEGGESSLRLSFVPVPAEQIGEGVSRIARALDRVRAGSPA